MVLSRMERHLRTKEALIALGGDAVLCVAPPQESANGKLSGITAVRIHAGQALILETGAWHWIPFPVGDETARFLVIFRSGTGRDDLYYHDFSQSISVRL
jgi:ureidoglycolate hydrolase